MWNEPLTATTRQIDDYTIVVTARAADGIECAAVTCVYNAGAGFGIFGEMRVLDDTGAPRQRLRALVLLTREALRFAADNGITRVHTEAPARLEQFAAAMCGIAPDSAGDRRTFAGELHAVRTHALRVSDATGALIGMTTKEERALDAAIDVLS